MMKYRFLKFLRADVSWHRRRFSSTAAARNQPVVCSKTRKKLPKAERKAMVVDYVNKYRMANAGKFPGPNTTKNHVGGSFYTIRAILQELEHDSNISAVVTADKISEEKPAVQRNDAFAAIEISDSVTPVHKIPELEKYGDLSKSAINGVGKMDNDRTKQILMRNRDTSLEDICNNQTTMDSRLESQAAGACGGPVDTRNLKSREVLEEQRFVEKTSSEMTLTESATEDCKPCERSGLPIESSDTSCSAFYEGEKASAQSPVSSVMAVHDTANAKEQDDGSMLPDVEIIKTSNMRQSAEADETSKTKETVDGDCMDNARSRRVFDESALVKDSADEFVKTFITESSQFCENRSYSPEDNGGASDSRSANATTTSPVGDSRGATQKIYEKEQPATLWGNLKSMASSFINIWRKP